MSLHNEKQPSIIKQLKIRQRALTLDKDQIETEVMINSFKDKTPEEIKENFIKAKNTSTKITFSDKYNIEKYCNIEEGFLEILPQECLVENNPVISFHVSQMQYHRKELENWLKKNCEGGDFEY